MTQILATIILSLVCAQAYSESVYAECRPNGVPACAQAQGFDLAKDSCDASVWDDGIRVGCTTVTHIRSN